ncbi:hypothetical protein CANINC_001170 [Pichia inconspicua]|uniref:Cullin family profile domain-containing protein n=1 Tax=Pichia inconspicua TaxID=52247 RepID=A0A4V4NG19_9ASCO|nr:hypothetical protein CANINC_001170 [[Candida] inconspicua]
MNIEAGNTIRLQYQQTVTGMKYLAYNPVTLKDFDHTAKGFRYYSRQCVEKTHSFEPNPISNEDCLIDGVVDLSLGSTSESTFNSTQENEILLLSNDVKNVQKIDSLLRLIDDINVSEDIPNKAKKKTRFLTPYKTSLSIILMDKLKCWVDNVKDALVIANLEVITKKFIYCKSLINIIAKYESVTVIKEWLKTYCENEFRQFLTDLKSFYNCIAHEVFTHANLLQTPEKAKELFDISLKVSSFVKESNIDIKLDLHFTIENVHKTIENLKQFNSIIVSNNSAEIKHPKKGSLLPNFKNLPNHCQKCFIEINSYILFCFYRTPKFYFLMYDDDSLSKEIKSMASLLDNSFLLDPEVCNALSVYFNEAIFTGKLKAKEDVSFTLQKLELLFHKEKSTVTRIIKINIHEIWNCILRFSMQKGDMLKSMKNAYYLYLSLFDNKEAKTLNDYLRVYIQHYFEDNFIDLYRPEACHNLSKFATGIWKSEEIGFDLGELLELQDTYDKAPILKSTADGVEVLVKPIQVDPDSYYSFAKNRKLRIPLSIRQTIRQLCDSFVNENVVVKHNTSYHLIELVMNIGRKKTEIICTPSIYAILSAFEDRDSCDFEKLMTYTKLKPNYFKSSLQRLRNEKLLILRSGRVMLNTDISGLPPKIVVINSRRLSK